MEIKESTEELQEESAQSEKTKPHKDSGKNNSRKGEEANAISQEIKKTTIRFFGTSAGGHFLSFWLTNFIVYIVTLGAIFQFIPSELKWLPKVVFLACILTALATSGYSAYKNKDRKDYFETTEAVVDALKVMIIGAAVLIVLYSFTLFLSPPDYVTTTELNQAMSDLRREFYTIGLNDTQTNQILDLLREGGYVTKEDLPEDLTEQQKAEVLKLINTSIQSFVATLTAVPQTSCYLTLTDRAESVYIRDKADKSGKIIDYLDFNDVALVLGNNGGDKQDMWWYIEVTHRGVISRGWIIGLWTKLEDEGKCLQVKQVATPFP